jgi:hypothetical protein
MQSYVVIFTLQSYSKILFCTSMASHLMRYFLLTAQIRIFETAFAINQGTRRDVFFIDGRKSHSSAF